jgi:hypothetical protein
MDLPSLLRIVGPKIKSWMSEVVELHYHDNLTNSYEIFDSAIHTTAVNNVDYVCKVFSCFKDIHSHISMEIGHFMGKIFKQNPRYLIG